MASNWLFMFSGQQYFCLNSLNCNGFKPTFCVYRTTIKINSIIAVIVLLVIASLVVRYLPLYHSTLPHPEGNIPCGADLLLPYIAKAWITAGYLTLLRFGFYDNRDTGTTVWLWTLCCLLTTTKTTFTSLKAGCHLTQLLRLRAEPKVAGWKERQSAKAHSPG